MIINNNRCVFASPRENYKQMKKTILIFVIALLFGLSANSQTLILTDTMVTEMQDTTFLKWYHVSFTDSDRYSMLSTKIALTKEVRMFDGTIYSTAVSTKRLRRIKTDLVDGDSIRNPNNGSYYKYNFVKNYIYNNGENMKRTLSLYFLLNQPGRLLE